MMCNAINLRWLRELMQHAALRDKHVS